MASGVPGSWGGQGWDRTWHLAAKWALRASGLRLGPSEEGFKCITLDENEVCNLTRGNANIFPWQELSNFLSKFLCFVNDPVDPMCIEICSDVWSQISSAGITWSLWEMQTPWSHSSCPDSAPAFWQGAQVVHCTLGFGKHYSGFILGKSFPMLLYLHFLGRHKFVHCLL